MSEAQRWIGGLSALVGAWVFVSAFVFGMVGSHFWNDIIVGAAIFVLAGYSAVQASRTGTGNAWSSGLACLLGLWMIATPFVWGAGTTTMFAYGSATATMWSGVLSGIAVAILSGYNAYEASDAASAASTETSHA